MDETKILLTNYPRIHQQSSFESMNVKKEVIDIQCGYDIQVDAHEITLQIARDLIMGILTYDTVYIEGVHLWDILQVWGSDYIKELLRLNILRVIPDQNLNPVLMRKEIGWVPDFFGYTSGTINLSDGSMFEPIQKEWAHLETTLYKHKLLNQDIQALLYLIDENKVSIDSSSVISKTITETYRDINNQSFIGANKLMRINEQGLREIHVLRLLRIHELNKTGVLAGLLGIDGVKTDGDISALMALKCNTAFNHPLTDGISSFTKITQEKGFPDLGLLFYEQAINLDQILKIRENFHAKIFRYWLKNSEYEEQLIRQEIMNSVHNVLGSTISNCLRMLACNLIGITGFLPGVLASAADSFILGKIAEGWHPNFFLTTNLKQR